MADYTSVLSSLTTAEIKKYINFSKTLVIKNEKLAVGIDSRLNSRLASAIRTSNTWSAVKGLIVYSSMAMGFDKGKLIVESRQFDLIELDYTKISDTLESTTLPRQTVDLYIDNEKKIWVEVNFTDTSKLFFKYPIVGSIRTESDFVGLDKLQVNVNAKSMVDIDKKIVFISSPLWQCKETEELSFELPTEGAIQKDAIYEDGLSLNIETPMAYASVKFKALSFPETLTEGIRQSILSFEEPGEWEDPTELPFKFETNGNIAVDEFGVPLINANHKVIVPCRGEKNEYYRSLLRKYPNLDLTSARLADNLDIIYWEPNSEITNEECVKFLKYYSQSKILFTNLYYSNAYAADDKYFEFSKLSVCWMAILRMINSKMEEFNNINSMENYEINNLLYSLGLDYFIDLPLIYRRRFAKNIEKLMMHKGTNEVFTDILDIFGADGTVSLWKYYMVKFFPTKSKRLVLDGLAAGQTIQLTIDGTALNCSFTSNAATTVNNLSNLITALIPSSTHTVREVIKKKTPTGFVLDVYSKTKTAVPITRFFITRDIVVVDGEPDYSKPDVGFIKTDIKELSIENIVNARDINAIEDYEKFVGTDPTWKASKEEVLTKNFSMIQTKYFSANAATDIIKNGMSITFLWNYLKDIEASGNTTNMTIPGASLITGVTAMTLFEGFVALLVLSLWKNGIDDIILYDNNPSDVYKVLKFRLDGAKHRLHNLYYNKNVKCNIAPVTDGIDSETVGRNTDKNLDVFKYIGDDVNSNIHQKYPYTGKDGGEETRAYSTQKDKEDIWKFNFIGESNNSVFRPYVKYSDWLRERNPGLHSFVTSVKTLGESDNTQYGAGAGSIIKIIEDVLNMSDFNLTVLFGANDTVMVYIDKMIRFFKAYTTELKNISTDYIFDSPAWNTVRLINYVASVDLNCLKKEGPLVYERPMLVPVVSQREQFALLSDRIAALNTNREIKDLLYLLMQDSRTLSLTTMLMNLHEKRLDTSSRPTFVKEYFPDCINRSIAENILLQDTVNQNTRKRRSKLAVSGITTYPVRSNPEFSTNNLGLTDTISIVYTITP